MELEDLIIINDDDSSFDFDEYPEMDDGLHWTNTDSFYCTLGVLGSLNSIILKLILCALSKRFLVCLHHKRIIGQRLLHLGIILTGLILIANQTKLCAQIFVFAFIISTPLLLKNLLGMRLGFVSLLLSIGTLIYWQYRHSAEEFLSIRGMLMIIVMKVSSLSFDVCNGSIDDLPLLSLSSYVFDGSTVVFGPWITFRDHQQSLAVPNFKISFMEIRRFIINIVLCLLFVVYSSCISEYFVSSRLIGAFFVAQSFRSSHYFVSLLSTTICQLSGVNCVTVTDWMRVEWPRSLIDVVVSWNIPMHQYLHKYVFVQVRRYGSAAAILVTYAMSSLLHGINFQLSSVLLSLGFYTYAEAKLRDKLSCRLNACVRAKKCHKTCEHILKAGSFTSVAINLSFRILAIAHLIYLGMVFDDSAAATGYSYGHTINVWMGSYFYSHIAGFLTLALSQII